MYIFELVSLARSAVSSGVTAIVAFADADIGRYEREGLGVGIEENK